MFINPKQPGALGHCSCTSIHWDDPPTVIRQAYAVAKPRDMNSLQRELMQRGPVEVAFFVAWIL